MKEKFSTRALSSIVAAMVISLASGGQYCWSLLSRSLTAEYGWSAVQATLPYTVMAVCAAAFAIVAGRMADKLPPRALALLGGATMGGGLFFSGLTRSPAVMVITIGLVLGIGSTTLSNCASPTAAKWSPPARKGLVLGIVSAGIGLSSLYMSPIVNALLASSGVAKTFMYVGAGVFVLVMAATVFLFDPPKAPAAEAARSVTLREALHHRELYLLWLMFFIGTIAQQIVTAQIAGIAHVQAGWEGGFLLVMLASAGNAIGRIVVPGLSDRIGVMNAFKIAFALQAANFFAFGLYRTPLPMAAGVFISGFCYGAVVPTMSVTALKTFGRGSYGLLWGIIQTAFGVSGLVGPMLSAALYDSTGAYTGSYLVAAVLALIGLALAIWGMRTRATSPASNVEAASL